MPLRSPQEASRPDSGFASAEDDLDDARLLRGVCAGQRAAASALWQRYAPVARRVVQRAMGPSGDVEDLVQEIFLRVFQNAATVRDPAALRAFVFTVTTSVLASHFRRQRVRRFLRLTQDGDLPEPALVSRNDEARDALRRVYAILEALRSGDRVVFVLRMLEGLGVPEVAEATGTSPATVKRRLGRANARIEHAVRRDPALAEYLGLAAPGGAATPSRRR